MFMLSSDDLLKIAERLDKDPSVPASDVLRSYVKDVEEKLKEEILAITNCARCGGALKEADMEGYKNSSRPCICPV